MARRGLLCCLVTTTLAACLRVCPHAPDLSFVSSFVQAMQTASLSNANNGNISPSPRSAKDLLMENGECPVLNIPSGNLKTIAMHTAVVPAPHQHLLRSSG